MREGEDRQRLGGRQPLHEVGDHAGRAAHLGDHEIVDGQMPLDRFVEQRSAGQG